MAHCLQVDPNAAHFWHSLEDSGGEGTNEKDTCSYCEEMYGGALIKCHQPGCKKMFHVECVFDTDIEGGFSLEAEGQALTFHCREHFQPILFCSCLRPYEKEKGMIQCDNCHDWFHYNCVGRKEGDSQAEEFICTFCTNADARYRSDIDAKRAANEAKDDRSMRQQTALDALYPVVCYLRLTLCPILEEIAEGGLASGAGRTKPCRFKEKGMDSITVANVMYIRDNLKNMMTKVTTYTHTHITPPPPFCLLVSLTSTPSPHSLPPILSLRP